MTTLNEFSFSKDLTHVHVIGDGVTAKAVRLVVARLEGFVLSELNSADIVVPSPGIDPKDYPETSAEIMSEPEFAYRLMRRPNSRFSPRIIAVTGTNGKSTLTALIAHVLGIPGLGNIGVPMITYVDKCCSFDWIVVELSSYQLDGCRYFLPDIAVLLNITPDHMTRYHGFDQYIASKEQLITLLSKDSILFYNQDCSTTKAICEKESVCQHKVKLSQTAHLSIQEALSSVPVYGAHAWFNLKACYLIAEVVGVPESMILSRCKSFESLPHRFEVFCEYQGLVFINDSKSTTPESSLVAIEAASSYGLPIHMILCGDDKGLSVSQLVSTIHAHCASLSLYGGIANKLEDCSNTLNESFPVYRFEQLRDLLGHLMSIIAGPSVVLFSPGSSSFDLYSHFQARGDAFKSEVQLLTKGDL